ncbi:MAG: efflux RND transporter periplasmic adaptor subunit [Myxococcota bacterium]|nr:efflux RND transporter periplasmic adaptor subunit [Myxococcota bacterium]
MSGFPLFRRCALALRARSARSAVCALGFSLAACGPGVGDSEEFVEDEPVSIEITTVESGLLRDIAGFSGQLSAENSVVVKAEDDGIVAEVFFEEGQEVAAGDPLFRLRNGEQVARLREAKANLDLARGVFERTHKLLRQDAVSQAKRDEAAASLAVAKARVELAGVELDRTVIRAPFDGVLGMRQVAPGSRVDETTALVEIDSVDRLQVTFAIAEVGVLFARVGTPVELTVAPYPGERFPGEVFFVSPTLDSSTRRLIVKAWVENTDRRLRAGLFARIHMEVDARENAIMVPEAAVVFDRRGTYVWRVGDDMVVSKVPVETGLRRDGEVEVRSGLQSGDRLVTAGTHKVDEGDKVVAVAPRSGAVGGAPREVPVPAGDGA